jgi:hypothetical protein
LPTSRKWKQVVAYFVAGDVDVAQLASAISLAAERAMNRAWKDDVFVEVCWLLIKIPQAARSGHFTAALKEVGVEVPEDPTLLDVIVGLDVAVEKRMRQPNARITDLGEMARLAAISALYEVAGERLPTLWKPGREDERTTLATFALPDKFAELSQRFFVKLMERNLLYYLDRE